MIQNNIGEQIKERTKSADGSDQKTIDIHISQTVDCSKKSVSIRKIAKLDDKQLHQYAKKYGSVSRKGQREFAAFLPEINKRGLFLKHKYHTISHYAAVYGSLNKKTVEAVLYVAKKFEDKPVLLELLPTQGWSKLRTICTVATAQNQQFWKEKVESMSKSALETFVSELKKQGDLVDGKLLGLANARGAGGEESAAGGEESGAGNLAGAADSGAGAVDLHVNSSGNPENMALNKQNMTIEEFLPGEKMAITQMALPEVANGNNFANFNAEHNSGVMQDDKALAEQGLADCGKAESVVGPTQPEQRNSISFKVTTEVEKQLRLFKYNLEKSKKQAVDWNHVMEEFLRITKDNEVMAEEIKTLKRAPERYAKKIAQKQKMAIDDAQNVRPEAKNAFAQPDNSNSAAKKNSPHPNHRRNKKIPSRKIHAPHSGKS